MTAPVGPDFALLTSGTIAALYDALKNGQQFSIMSVGSVWLFFYHGKVLVH